MKLKKEREVTFLIQKHLDNIKQWLNKTSEAVHTYYMDDIDKLKLIVLSKNEFKNSANNDRQCIWRKLCAGAYLPVIRGNLFNIANNICNIADAATQCCETFLFERPEIPQNLFHRFSSITRITFNLFPPVYESTLYYLRGTDVLKITSENANIFWKLRAEAILIEDELKREIYSSTLDRWHKNQLNMCVQSISAVSQKASEMEDEIQLIMTKTLF
jgi:uncharacterized protein Yka (UPF0111/DUF47 family)